MKQDEWMAKFQERITALEQENMRLRTELQVCQHSLAPQVGVAELECANALLQTELAEEAKQAAIAREQEKAALEQAAELAKANDALKQALDMLAMEPELNKFVGHVLKAIAHQFQSPLTEYWYHADDTAYIGLINWQGQILDREEIAQTFPSHVGLNGFKVPPGLIGCESLQQRKQHIVYEDHSTNPFIKDLDWIIGELVPRGLIKEINVPLVLGDTCIGALTIHLPHDHEFTPQQIELAQALAHQATLAVELTRVSEISQQSAILEERNRMAREIHDTLAQAFTGISIHLEIAKRLTKSQPESACTLIEQAIELTHTGLAEARRSVWALHPDADEYRDLVQSLGRTLQQMTSSTSIQAELQIQGTPYSLPPDVGLHLLRIGQEALTNALKYAQAQHIIIQLQFTPASVSLRVQDDGCGFDPNQSDNGGFGLVGMQQRCQRLGGQLTFNSQPGQGTAIVVEVPLVQGEASSKGK